MTVPKHEPFIKEVKGHKVIVVHTLNGDINVSQEAVEHAKEIKKKTWRPLSYFPYPTTNLDHDLAKSFPASLIFNLHQTFRDCGYTEFDSVISINSLKSESFSGTSVTLITQHARYTGELTKILKKLWGMGEDRSALQDEMNAVLIDLQKHWSVGFKLSSAPESTTAYHFVYDPEGFRISITPTTIGSTDPSDYPNGVTTTSELLTFLVAHLHSSIAMWDLDFVLRSYPLYKLTMQLMDGNFSFDDVRINNADPEEWDYINPSADKAWGARDAKPT